MNDTIKDSKGRTVRHVPYMYLRGRGPEGMTCATCAFLLVREVRSARRFFKCGWCSVTDGPATDIRKKDPSCAKYEHQPGRQLYPAHPPSRVRGQSMLTIKEDVEP